MPKLLPTEQVAHKEEAAADRKRLLTRREVAEEYGLSHRWLEVAACRGEGPPMVRITPRMIRYRVSDVENWIASLVVLGNSRGK
jgi:predicted DNA-binding transcriptional regulator AlpA